jgi:hypothetical protein
MSSDEIKAKFGGKWKVYKNENFDEMLKDMGKFVGLKCGTLSLSIRIL